MANFERLVLGCIEAKFWKWIVNTRWKALGEIYNIYTLLHCSAFLLSSTFAQQNFSQISSNVFAFSRSYNLYSQNVTVFAQKRYLKFTNFDEPSSEFHNLLLRNPGKYQMMLDSQIWFPEISQRTLSIFRKWFSKR